MLAMILAILVNYLAHMDAARVVCEREYGYWSDTYGCQDRGPEEDELATCADCETAEECNRLCEVAACDRCGQRGCWMPEDLNCNAKVRP